MDKKSLIVKWLVLTFVVLFIITSILPNVGSQSMEKSRGAIEHQNVSANIGEHSKYSYSPFILYFNSRCNIKGSGSYLILPFGTTFFQIFYYYKSYLNGNVITINCLDLHDTFFGWIDFQTIGGLFPKSVRVFGFLKLVGFEGTLSLRLKLHDPYPVIEMAFEGHTIYARAFGYNRGSIC